VTDFLRLFADNFSQLGKDNLHRLNQMYSQDVYFCDPLQEVQGLRSLRGHFANLYGNAEQLDFDFRGFDYVREGEGYLRWQMSFRHPHLRAGQLIEVEGCSHLKWRDKVYCHRDYFDAGAMVYEHVPVVGRLIRWLKAKMP